MNLISKLKNPKIQQNLLEVILPIAGYLFWDWSLLIIVVFYLIDYLAAQIMFNRKLYFAQKYQSNWFKYVLPISIFSFATLFIIMGMVLWYTFKLKEPLEVLIKELVQFFKDELWLLFPVVLLSYFMMDKMFYYMPRRFMQTDVKSYAKKNVFANFVAVILVVVGALVYPYIQLNTLIVILIIVGVKLIFDLVIKTKLLKLE